MHIPVVDLKAQYRTPRTGVDAAIAAVIDGTASFRGNSTADFERDKGRGLCRFS